MRAVRRALVASALAVGCGSGGSAATTHANAPVAASPVASPPATSDAAAAAVSSPPGAAACGGGAKLRVHFYDVGQGLAALVELPDGRHVLVDAGDTPSRPKCDDVCAKAHDHLLATLARDLGASPIDMLWVTHPHSDHMGGAAGVMEKIVVRVLADNGLDADKPEIKSLYAAASKRGVSHVAMSPGATVTPLTDARDIRLRAVTPPSWAPHCKDDANDCSIALRIDYCASSVLFTGDAEKSEEKTLEIGGPVTLLQVGHHGSQTSSSTAFLARALPRYAVISSGKPDEGLNRGYCHPRASSVDALSRVLGGARPKVLKAYAESKCESPSAAGWVDTPASDRLFATARDGDVVLSTAGDGTFARE